MQNFDQVIITIDGRYGIVSSPTFIRYAVQSSTFVECGMGFYVGYHIVKNEVDTLVVTTLEYMLSIANVDKLLIVNKY